MRHLLTIYTFTLALLLINISIQEIDVLDESNEEFTFQTLKLPTLIPVDNVSPEDPLSFQSPKSEDDLKQLMETNHNFHIQYSNQSNNSIDHTQGVLISLKHFSEIHCCHGDHVYVGAGVSYLQLIDNLKNTRYALTNVPNDIHENVVSSIINAGFSGNFYSSLLANEVIEIVVLRPNGMKRYYTPRDDEFKSITLGFGFVGVVIGVSLKVVPDFDVQKCIYQNMLHYDFTRKLHLLFYGRNYSWFFLDLKTMKWEVHQLFFQDSKTPHKGIVC
jgi:FAD/FMN-containing dehydrogenase